MQVFANRRESNRAWLLHAYTATPAWWLLCSASGDVFEGERAIAIVALR
ncbi:MAG: hypothetical protein ACXVH3_29680 [Solirubrobacteraceae bacterium]